MHIDKLEIATYYIWDKAKCHSFSWLVGIFMLLHFQVKSQTFPVTATTQVTPPYSVFLADYTLPETNQLKLNLLLRDVTEPSYDVRLHFSIEGAGIKIESRNNIVVPPITLEGGVPRLLTALELAPYLDNNNLSFSGITRRAYETAGALPDGFYRMCFRVVDYRRPDVVLSRSSCANAWFILNDPPRINLPQCGNILPLQDPQNIFFQWLPMNTGSPNAAFNTEYLLEIYEIRPAGRNPNEVVRTANPIFRTTTDFTTYVYGMADPPLIPGLSYAFRVQARDKSGRDLFKNDGFSEVCSFTFGEVNTLEAPTNISTVVESERRARVSWDTNTESTGYLVEYRKSGSQSFTWFEADVQETEYLIKDLEPDTDYELRVYSILDNFKSAASPNERFKTPAPQVFSCGSSYGAILPENRTPLTTAMVGNIIKVGNFEMKLLEVSGGDGVFSGYGAVMIPYLGTRIVSKFTNVKINELQELFEGEVFALTEGVDGLRDRWEDEEEADDSDGDNSDSGDDSNDNGNIEIDHAGDIDTVYIDINTGDIVVVDTDGEETVYDGPETDGSDEENDNSEDIIITDENGDTWTVGDDGSVTSPNNPDTPANDNNGAANVPLITYGGERYSNGATITLDSATTQHLFSVAPVSSDSTLRWQIVDNTGTDLTANLIDQTLIDKPNINLNLTNGTGDLSLKLFHGNAPVEVTLVNLQGQEQPPVDTEPSIPKVWFNENNTLYSDGESITLDFTNEVHNVAFDLRGQPSNTKSYKWRFIHNGIDRTLDVKNNADTLYNFGMDIGGKSGDMYLEVTYDGNTIQVPIVINRKEFSLKELYAVPSQTGKAKRVATSGQTLYLIDKDNLFEPKRVRYDITLNPNLDREEYGDLDIAWSWEEQTQSKNREYKFGSKYIVRPLNAQDKPITTNVSAGYPEEVEKSINVQFVENELTTLSFANKFKDFLSFLNVVNEVSDAVETVAPCETSFLENFDRNMTWQWVDFNAEDQESRHVLETKRFEFAIDAGNLASFGCKKGLGVTVFGYSISLGEIYFNFTAGANVSIRNDEIYYLENQSLKDKYSFVQGGLKVGGQGGIKGGIGKGVNNGDVEIGLSYDANIAITGGGRIEYPYQGNTKKIAGILYINPLTYNFTASVKLGPLSKDFKYSDILWDVRKQGRAVYDMETGTVILE